MVFSSMLFLWIFLPLVLAAYYLSPRKIRNGILVFFQPAFYAWGEPIYILLMLCSVLVNFMGGIFMEDHKTHRKGILWGTVLINLGLLGYFKYFNFLAEIIGKILPGGLGNLSIPQVALPIGISFYTFQALSYVIDVYRGGGKGTAEFLVYAFVHFLFPPADRRTNCKVPGYCAADSGTKGDCGEICGRSHALLLGPWEKGSSGKCFRGSGG